MTKRKLWKHLEEAAERINETRDPAVVVQQTVRIVAAWYLRLEEESHDRR